MSHEEKETNKEERKRDEQGSKEDQTHTSPAVFVALISAFVYFR